MQVRKKLGCYGKVPHKSYKQAIASLKNQQHRDNMYKKGKGTRVQPYRCPFCQKWHVGSTNWPGRFSKTKVKWM